MNKNIIIEALKEILYPGYSRDIVSLGIVENINIDNNIITITLRLSTNNEIKENIENNIHLNLNE